MLRCPATILARVTVSSVCRKFFDARHQTSRAIQSGDRSHAEGLSTQSTRERDPSNTCKMSLMETSDGSLASMNPPWAPRMDLTSPAALRGLARFHKYFCEMPWRLEMSFKSGLAMEIEKVKEATVV